MQPAPGPTQPGEPKSGRGEAAPPFQTEEWGSERPVRRWRRPGQHGAGHNLGATSARRALQPSMRSTRGTCGLEEENLPSCLNTGDRRYYTHVTDYGTEGKGPEPRFERRTSAGASMWMLACLLLPPQAVSPHTHTCPQPLAPQGTRNTPH